MQVTDQVFREVVEAKNHGSRNFKQFTNNFYLVKAALRYYTVKRETSFTSTDIAEDFPVPLNAAGSSLKILEELNVIQRRTDSSQKRYMPRNTDLGKLEEIQQVLKENREINTIE